MRATKFNKSRELPFDASTLEALRAYAGLRDGLVPDPSSQTFFVSRKGVI